MLMISSDGLLSGEKPVLPVNSVELNSILLDCKGQFDHGFLAYLGFKGNQGNTGLPLPSCPAASATCFTQAQVQTSGWLN
jgi:hypothetical protein